MKSRLKSLSLTSKLAAVMVAANIVGIAALAAYSWNNETTVSLANAVAKWKQNSEQFASIAAGGIKWGKADVVRDAYSLYRDDPALNLIGFVALNQDGQAVDAWRAEGAADVLSDSDVKAAIASAGEGATADTAAHSGAAVVTVTLPENKLGNPSGHVVTAWSTDAIYATAQKNALTLFAIQAVVIVLSVSLFLFALRRLVGTPLQAISGSIQRMQDGDYDTEVPYQANGDEIGFVARALNTFRTETIEKQAESLAAERERREFEEERARNAENATEASEAQARAVARVAEALELLASGDFTAQLDNLGPDFEKLVEDFNRMVAAVSSTLAEIRSTSDAVEGGSTELANSADTLAKRTEHTAAALEQTAAALHEITNTVKNSSEQAAEAGTLVVQAKADAASSANVMRDAIGAMDRIQESSSKIARIISVIDEIAFQTNLLALNAGVEAARAGDAGKGFAVVAHEVRELAQRSANAAKEISALISASGDEVNSGVTLVKQTGDALLTIEDQVGEINDRIQAIVSAYREQSTGLEEINSAIVSMDQTTQQNAAMVEETNAACQELRSQGHVLKRAVNRFTIPAGQSPDKGSEELARKPDTKVARPGGRPAISGNTALAVQPDEWEEF